MSTSSNLDDSRVRRSSSPLREPIEQFVRFLAIVGLGMFAVCAPLKADGLCGGPLAANVFQRPLDFNDPNEEHNLFLINIAHFTPEVEALIRGKGTASPPDDLHYVLMGVPNYYRALAAMANWQLANPRPRDAKYLTIECYYERAFAFRPSDPKLRLGYATYLHRARRLEEARVEYQKAEELGDDDAELFYNRGLLELEMGNVVAARRYADKAYELGYPLSGLKNLLNATKSAERK